MDATKRARPNGQTLEALIAAAKEKYPRQLFMADCATYEEGMAAAKAGFDLIGTTLCGYTEESKNDISPNYHMMSSLARNSGKHVIAEGNLWTTLELQNAMSCGVWAAVVGSAITRPMLITRRFANAINGASR
jgi:N-acylglucosamine-6-phosphate 2-epimerase